MALPPARISLAVAVPNAVIKVAGRAAVERSRDFKMTVQNLEAIGVREFYLDLSQSLVMDSMFTGVVANLASGPNLKFTLVDANQRVTDLLANLGALQFFSVLQGLEGVPEVGPARDVPPSTYEKLATTECCLESHRFLMGLQAENRARFGNLEKVLEAELLAAPSGAPVERVPPPASPAAP